MHTVLLENFDRRYAHIRRLIRHHTASKKRDLSQRGGRNLCCPSTLPPPDQCLRGKSQDLSISMNADQRFYQPAKKPEAKSPIGKRCQQTPEALDEIRLDQPPIAPTYPPCCGQMLFPRDHQAGEIESVLMRRRIRTVVVTEFTVIALIDNPMVVGNREFGDVAFIAVYAVEQRIERRTQIETPSAAIADFINTLRVFLELHGLDGVNQAQTIHVSPIRKQSAVSYQRQGGVQSSSSPSEN